MQLGVHVSTAGGYETAIDRACDLGCNTFQIFVSNPRGWKASTVEHRQAKFFCERYQKAGMSQAVSHSIYLINLASENDFIKEQSVNSLKAGLENTYRLGLSGLVTHIGSHKGMSLKDGIERVSESIFAVFSKTEERPDLLLENTAGAGNLVGDRFEEIGAILKKVKDKKLAFCLDTAHAFESGYPVNDKRGLDNTLIELDKNIGLGNLKAIHLNDSKSAFSSHLDRHEDFGEGQIGLESMIRIINHPSLKDKVFIMETPQLKSGEKGREFIDQIRSYQK